MDESLGENAFHGLMGDREGADLTSQSSIVWSVVAPAQSSSKHQSG